MTARTGVIIIVVCNGDGCRVSAVTLALKDDTIRELNSKGWKSDGVLDYCPKCSENME